MPRWIIRLRTALRFFLRRGRLDHELNEELQYHLERDVQERLNSGATREEARRAAIHAMGPIERSREECRDLRRGHRLSLALGHFVQDVRFGLRLFRRHRLPIAIALGGLAAAIGVVTAIFSIVNATLLRPYGMDDPSSVVRVVRPDHHFLSIWPYTDFRLMHWATDLGTLEAVAETRVRFSTERTVDGWIDRRLLFVSGGYLPLLGGRSVLGRSLGPLDDQPGAPPAIVVSHYFWRTYLDSDPSVIGRIVWVNDAPVTLVGVLQPTFTGPHEGTESIWAPLSAFDDLGAGPEVTLTTGPQVAIVGRVAPGVGTRALRDNLVAVLSQAPDRQSTRRLSVHVYGAESPLDGPADWETYTVLGLVFGMCALVLALACANLANLLMASVWARAREVGVRLAMGASGQRILMQLVHECLLLGLAAGVFGLVLAFWLVPVFAGVADVRPDVSVSPDVRVVIVALILAIACGLGSGLGPARYGARRSVVGALQFQGGSRGTGGVPSRFRLSFIGFQAAVSMLLLVVAALFSRSAVRMTSVDIGFDAERLVSVSFSAPRSEFDEASYIARALAVVRGLPSVERASVSQYLPFGSSVEHDRFSHEGSTFEVNVMRADIEFLATAGLRVVRGRTFTPEEVIGEQPVVLISHSVAETFFPGRDPIGRSLAEVPSETGQPQPSATIIGVVADALMTRVEGERFGSIYHPLASARTNPPGLLIRTARPGATARAVEDALRGIDPRVDTTTGFVRARLDDYLDFRRRLAWVFGPAAVLSLLLAALGVYGVTTFVVGLRTEEVSVRLALGASAGDVARMLAKDALRPVMIGLAVGLCLALVFSRFVAADELAGVHPFDPPAIGVAVSTVVASAIVAVLLPTIRAVRVSPAELLRRG